MARIEVLQPVPCQVDGEPWILHEGDSFLVQPRPRPLDDELANTEVYVVQGPGQVHHQDVSTRSNQTQSLEHSPSSGSLRRLSLALLRAKGTFFPSNRRRQEEGANGVLNSESAPRTTENGSLFHRSVPT